MLAFFAAMAIGLATGEAMGAGACTLEGAGAPLVRFREPSLFGDVLVVDEGGMRYLRFGSPCGADQSALSLREPHDVPSEYLRIAALGLAFARRQEHVLMLGLGGGVLTNAIARALPSARIDAVDVDPVVIEAARRFFGVQPSDRYRLHVADAAAFVRRTEQRYDLVVIDAYDGDGMPDHLTTPEFFAGVGALLRPGGVVVANFGLDVPTVYLRLAHRLRDALGDALCVSAREEANLVVFAGAPGSLRRDAAQIAARRLDEDLHLPFALAPIAQRLRRCP